MTDTTTEHATEAWTTWPTGAAIEQTDASTWVWTGKRIGGKHLIARPEQLTDGWYRLLESDQLADYTRLPYRPTADENVVHWLWRAAQIDVQRLQERNANQAISSDWNTLNEHLNEYADEESLCSSFEKKLDEWNGTFGVMSLTGRVKEYEVEMTVHMTFTTTVLVEATSPDEASTKADDLDWDDVTQNISLCDAGDESWDVDDVSDAG